jgi:hypothetical protein
VDVQQACTLGCNCMLAADRSGFLAVQAELTRSRALRYPLNTPKASIASCVCLKKPEAAFR